MNSRRDSYNEPKEFEEKIVGIDRVARVVKGGRRFRFRATVVIGDRKGRVGVAVAKGQEVTSAIAKAVAKAKKEIITVPMNETTIVHEIELHFGGTKVLLKPAKKGTGVIAGGSVRAVVDAAGIRDIVSKTYGSANKINTVYTTFMALKKLQSEGPAVSKPSAKKSEPEAAEAAK